MVDLSKMDQGCVLRRRGSWVGQLCGGWVSGSFNGRLFSGWVSWSVDESESR